MSAWGGYRWRRTLNAYRHGNNDVERAMRGYWKRVRWQRWFW